jgi:hypothetical protein
MERVIEKKNLRTELAKLVSADDVATSSNANQDQMERMLPFITSQQNQKQQRRGHILGTLVKWDML